MPTPIQSLFAAILDEDRAKVEGLIEKNPVMATRGVAEEERYESRIAHWIYAGDSALHVAAAGYRVEIARMLLAAGADSASARNRRCGQPLHYAADGYLDSPSWNARRQVSMIRLLLKAGAIIDAQDKNGATPLHRAVRTRCAAAVKCLLEAGADPTIRNKPGSTPFHLAVQNTGRGGSGSEKARAAQCEILQAFLERGVRPTLTDAKGKSILEWARSDWIQEMLEGSDKP
jgi:Ankyrin repeats (3 copies)/Ankyrin repeat